MRAVARRGQELVLDELPDPQPGPGQVLVKTLSCGICGSDLHALHHMDKMLEGARRTRFPDMPEPRLTAKKDIVFGHEFCAEIVEFGPDCQKQLSPGTRVCSVPGIIGGPDGFEAVGYSNDFPGGYGEYMVLTEGMLLPVPNGLPTDHAALTEPFAVGVHAVAKAAPTKDDVFLVIGCGPVGLSVISALKADGFGPVIASDFSPARRKLAETLGADIVVDPAEVSPYTKWKELGVPRTAMELTLAQMTGQTSKRPVIFECIGVPGILQNIIDGAPTHARIVVVGVCMEKDTIEPFIAINKQLDLHFVLGYTPDEFSNTLRRIADGEIVAAPIITGEVGLDGVAQAFKDLADPEQHAKIIIHPWGE